jgi:hypothetical protein
MANFCKKAQSQKNARDPSVISALERQVFAVNTHHEECKTLLSFPRMESKIWN